MMKDTLITSVSLLSQQLVVTSRAPLVIYIFQIMKLYSVSDGPPSLACQQLLKALDIKNELINMNFRKGEHLTKEYEKLNPQKEIPTLVDNDLGNAILQYLADQYDTSSSGKLYPKTPKLRAIMPILRVNYHLCFNLALYYRNICEYTVLPIFYDCQRTPLSLKKAKIALDIYNTYLQRENSEYAAGNNLTIADFPLITSMMCSEAIDFKLDAWPYVAKWYDNFKRKHSDLWEITAGGTREISY